MYNLTLRRVRLTIIAAEKHMYYIFWVCVFVALGIQRAMHMHYIAICGLSGS
jgi:hypothetical protein